MTAQKKLWINRPADVRTTLQLFYKNILQIKQIFKENDFRHLTLSKNKFYRQPENQKPPRPKNQDFLNMISTPWINSTENSSKNNHKSFINKETFLALRFLILKIYFYTASSELIIYDK